jgi:hypothetical protein
MCNQTVCLVQAALERVGICTVSITLLREVAEQLRPPRALFVPEPLGYPLGAPHQPDRQHQILDAAFQLLSRTDLPVLETFGSSSQDADLSDIPLFEGAADLDR